MPLQKAAPRAVCTALLGLMLAMPVAAASTVSRFEPAMAVQGTPLVLNGAGTRYRAVFKVYDMGLYLPRKAATREEVLAMPGPKRLEFAATRDIDSTDIGLAFVKGMRANARSEQMTRHLPGTTRLIEIFSSRPKLLSGDRFAIEYAPGKGTTFFVQGEPQGAPVGDAEFFGMVLNIWLGDSPAEPLLRDALLGN